MHHQMQEPGNVGFETLGLRGGMGRHDNLLSFEK
jgi:hypothetical protein